MSYFELNFDTVCRMCGSTNLPPGVLSSDPHFAGEEHPDLEVIEDALQTARALEELCESDDSLNDILLHVRRAIEEIEAVKLAVEDGE